jgi:hypothetical protein
LAKGESGFVSDWGLLLGGQLLDGGTVFTQINFGSDQDERDVGAVVRNFRIPLGPQVFEGGGIDDGIGQQENVGLRIREGSKTIIIFLSSGIPETQIDGLSVDYHIGRIAENCESPKDWVSTYLSKTVGMYSPGKALVVYEINKQVLPTAPSPTTTHLMACI